MSISTRGIYCLTRILNRKSVGHELDQLIVIAMGNIFSKILLELEDWVLIPGPFYFTNLTQFAKVNHDQFVIFHFFESVDWDKRFKFKINRPH